MNNTFGIVVPGGQQSSKLGYPTANMKLPVPFAFPGTYAVQARWEENPWRIGIAHIGYHGEVVEVHILDFEGNILGKEVEIKYLQQLHGLHKYESWGALTTQLQEDEQEAREFFETEGIV